MLTIQKIIEEADARVPNAFNEHQKVDWINEVNVQFFDLVRIPQFQSFIGLKDVKDYTLNSGVRSKLIDRVMIGSLVYESAQYGNVPYGRSYWTYDDTTNKLTVNPAPIETNEGIVKHYRVSSKTFLASNLSDSPDAPSEYHWLYILGLCERIAKAMEDISLANNYANEFATQLQVARESFGVRS